MSVKTESRDRKQKEAAAAFVVAEECGNVEALCQTFLKWGQDTFSQRGKATTTTKKKVEERGGKGTAAPVSLRRSLQSRERGGRAGGRCGARRGQRAQFPAGVGRPRRFLRCRAAVRTGERRGGGAAGGGGLRSLRRLLSYLCGPRPASDRGAGSRGAFLGSPRIRLHLL